MPQLKTVKMVLIPVLVMFIKKYISITRYKFIAKLATFMKGKSDAFTAMFFVLAIASAVLTMPLILNYIEFYKAIAKFDLSIAEVKLDKSFLERLEVIITFNLTVSNPTGFSGLTVQSISSKLYYENGMHTVPSAPYELRSPRLVQAKYFETTLWKLKNSQTPCSKRLGPHQNVTIPITFYVTPHLQHLASCGTGARFDALDFIMFLDTHKGNINWRLQGVVYLSTFLGAHSIPFEIYAQSTDE